VFFFPIEHESRLSLLDAKELDAVVVPAGPYHNVINAQPRSH